MSTRSNGASAFDRLRRVDPRLWAALLCAAGLTLGWVLMLRVGGLADETVHFPQIRSFLEAFPDGPWTLDPRLTTFPTYHALVAAVLALTGTSSLTAARTVDLAISAALLAVFAAAVLRIHGRRTIAARRMAQLAFLPILFPFFFLVYTDVLSLLLVLLGVLLADRPRPVLAPLAAWAAVLVRQTNVVWAVWIALVHLRAVDRNVSAPPDAADRRWRLLGPAAPYALLAAATVGFVLWHGGLALGDPAAHPPGALHAANVDFFLLVLLVCFLPLHLPALKRVAGSLSAALRRRPWRERLVLSLLALAALAAGFLLFTWSFEVSHPYNRFLGSLRNRALDFFTHGELGTLTLFTADVVALLALVGTRLTRPLAYALYPLSAAFLAAHWLVEQRYDFIPLALWLLYREEAPPWAERLQLVWGIALTAFLHLGVVNRWFFL
jgi:alpha-1,2-glucosyltransferase